MIDSFAAKNYGCLNDVRVRLTPLHALIGPNDSGKSTILRGLRTLAVFGMGRGVSRDADALLRYEDQDGSELAASDAGPEFRVRTLANRVMEFWRNQSFSLGDPGLTANPHPANDSDALRLRKSLERTGLVRFRPEELRTPTALLHDSQRLDFLNDRGLGLAAVLDGIRDRDEEAWRAILDEARRMFPSIQRMQLQVRAIPGTNPPCLARCSPRSSRTARAWGSRP